VIYFHFDTKVSGKAKSQGGEAKRVDQRARRSEDERVRREMVREGKEEG
jgi:hypothetical protein